MLESSSPKAEGSADQRMQARKNALESSTGILELALAEFPGCALLHLYYLESLSDYIYQIEGLHQLNIQNGAVGMEVDDRRATQNKLSNAFEHAWKSVGRGSHVNEGTIVSEIYRLHGSFTLFRLSMFSKEWKTGTGEGSGTNVKSETDAILQQLSTLFQKWSSTPMGEGSSDEMMQELEYLWDEACSLLLLFCDGEEQRQKRKEDLEQKKATLWANIDGERKKTSALMSTLSPNENEIDFSMSNEGIALPKSSLFPQRQDDPNGSGHGSCTLSLKRVSAKWNRFLLGESNRFLSGLGGSETSRAFLKGISFLQRIYQDVAKRGNKAAPDDRSPLQDYVATHKYSVIVSSYERAISECPTVEAIWVSYLNFLRGEWSCLRKKMKDQKHMLRGEALYFQQQEKEELLSLLQSTPTRATRNCPYSSSLFEVRMTILGLISVSNLEPDNITAVVQEATELGFLNQNREAMLHLRLVAILVVKRRLLSLVSLGTTRAAENDAGKDYDEIEAMGSFSAANRKQSTNGVIVYQSLNPTVMEELQDLLEDIRDMYDEADTFLFKAHQTWTEGRVVYWKHRALTEAYVLCPISLALKKAFTDDVDMAENNGDAADKEAVKCFDKLVKAQKPSHPDSWREYIRYVSASHLYLAGNATTSTHGQPDGIATSVSELRNTRFLYHQAMSSVKKACQESSNISEINQSWMGKGIDSAVFSRDYNTSLSDLCREYLEFERAAGSEESLSHALTLVRSKLADWNPPSALAEAIATAHESNNDEHSKRKLEPNNPPLPENDTSIISESQDMHGEEEIQSKSKRAKVKINLKQPKMTDGLHKVRVGKMEYPAHPFTIHVSNLNKDTQDMDLVDAFRSDVCGIVHAKILREKRTGKGGHHYHGESKCAGLVQFEERQSVENALQQNGQFEIRGKKIKIQRSHLPAVGVVPPGMHRVKPRGEGKISKRNKLKKESKMKVDTSESMDVEEEGKGTQKNHVTAASPSSLSLSVLSFKPRGMRQKPKIDLNLKKK